MSSYEISSDGFGPFSAAEIAAVHYDSKPRIFKPERYPELDRFDDSRHPLKDQSLEKRKAEVIAHMRRHILEMRIEGYSQMARLSPEQISESIARAEELIADFEAIDTSDELAMSQLELKHIAITNELKDMLEQHDTQDL